MKKRSSAGVSRRRVGGLRVVNGGMDLDANAATALLSALGLAREHGGAASALAAADIELPASERFVGMTDDVGHLIGRPSTDASVSEALALGFLAGRIAHRPRKQRLHDPTSFVMDRELVVQAAEGESIMRLPWFEDGLFVGRRLPEISEMPLPVRRLCIEKYSAASAGERGRFMFTSYGHTYSVDAIPVHGDDGDINAVLAIATPARSFAYAATACERTAERLDRSATNAEQRAERHRVAGRGDAEVTERKAAARARRAAERARANARRLSLRDGAAAPAEPPSITPRETEVLSLASHGLIHCEIAELLGVSSATVRTHLQNIYPKLGVCDKAAAVAAALRHGIIE
jgi:DNA-binding CsgD family transcriptional regulator